MLSVMFGKRTAGMLICAMFTTRLNWAFCGMYREVLIVVLPVVQPSPVVWEDEMVQKSSRLSWTPPAGCTVVKRVAYGDTTIGVNRHRSSQRHLLATGVCKSHLWVMKSFQMLLFKLCTTYITVIIVSVHSRLYRLLKHGSLHQLGKGQKSWSPIHCRAHTHHSIRIHWTKLVSPI